MSTCSRCKTHYRELEDEQGDHDCFYCGLTPEERERVGEEEEESKAAEAAGGRGA